MVVDSRVPRRGGEGGSAVVEEGGTAYTVALPLVENRKEEDFNPTVLLG